MKKGKMALEPEQYKPEYKENAPDMADLKDIPTWPCYIQGKPKLAKKGWR
jgi:hypothetical protein